MLSARGIQKYYGSLWVLKGVDVDIKKGEIVSIVGPSGCGKSTLLHILGTLDEAMEGRIELREQAIHTLKGEALAVFRNRHIGFVFQFHHLLPEFSALERLSRTAATTPSPSRIIIIVPMNSPSIGDRIHVSSRLAIRSAMPL